MKLWVVVTAGALVGCGTKGPGSDGGEQDAGAADAAVDAGQDAGSLDAGTPDASADFYVSLSGRDDAGWTGTLAQPNAGETDGPFASIAAAQGAVRGILLNPGGRTAPVVVDVRGGVYYGQQLTFGTGDGSPTGPAVIWQSYPGETPVLSGGVRVTGWAPGAGNAYTVTLPAGTQNFENLFYNGVRRLRPRLGGPLGTYLRVEAPVYLDGGAPPAQAPDPNCTVYVPDAGWECYDRFHYAPTDPIVSTWVNLNAPYPVGDIELLAFEKWTAPKLRVQSVDESTHTIYCTGPTELGPENEHGFISQHRYLIENLKDALSAAGQWFLDRSVTPWQLTYLANTAENPNVDVVVIPQSPQVLVANGLQNVTFSGLTFENDNFVVPDAGYASIQQDEPLWGAVACYDCQGVTFDGVTVTQTSASGLELKTAVVTGTTAHNVVQNCAVYDVGGNGIRIGDRPSTSDTDANVAQFNVVQQNVVEGIGRVFPSGVGIIQGSGHDNLYTHNDIYDGYHAGMEVCVPPCIPGHNNSNGSFNNEVSYTHAYDLFQGMTDDSGGLYIATGFEGFDPPGNKLLNNKVHDLTSAEIMDADGYGGHGLYMDNFTGRVDVENNLIFRVSGAGFQMTTGPSDAGSTQANTLKNNIVAYARQGLVKNDVPWREGTSQMCPPAPSLIFNATNNLFYFDRQESAPFSAQVGCEYECGFPITQIHNWQSNLFWRTDGGFASDPDAFHVQPHGGQGLNLCGSPTTWQFLSFSGWQGLGEDTASVVQDPGFANPTADDYSLPGGSPGAGFTVFDASQAGRTAPVLMPPAVPATFVTETYDRATGF